MRHPPASRPEGAIYAVLLTRIFWAYLVDAQSGMGGDKLGRTMRMGMSVILVARRLSARTS
ncbi:hypothetical protein ASF76_16480 [Microbacterium sp. Leaf151]|nr:hypothetical protein ASF76_16480 [Microbacterium sp. Leaf151]